MASEIAKKLKIVKTAKKALVKYLFVTIALKIHNFF